MYRNIFLLSACALSLILTGCGKRSPQNPLPTTPPPDKIVAKVNAASLTWQEMEMRAMGYMQDDIKYNHLIIPSNRLEEAKEYFRRKSIHAFIYKTIMLAEAQKQNIHLTNSDRQTGLKILATHLKSRNWTTNDFFLHGPMPEPIMRREFEDGQVVDKLLLLNVRNHISVKDADINAMITTINATNNFKRVQLEKIRTQLLDGADFATVARNASECPSAKNNGDLGEITRGKIDPVLEEAAFSQAIGAIGPVITSRRGHHIVLVTSRLPAQAATDSTPAVPETAHISHILIKTIAIERKKISDTILNSRYKDATKRYFIDLKTKAKIECLLYPDMRF